MARELRELKAVDISDAPDLLRLAEEVRDTKEPRLLRRDTEDIAVIMPVKPITTRRSKRTLTPADYEAFRSAAGGWSEVDTDKLITDIYADRAISDRPPVDL